MTIKAFRLYFSCRDKEVERRVSLAHWGVSYWINDRIKEIAPQLKGPEVKGINLAEALYLDLHDLGLGVSVINPGFVATRLTARNDFTMPALISPEAAAEAMLQGWARGQFDIHFPKRFTRVMKLLRVLPYRCYFPAVRRLTGL